VSIHINPKNRGKFTASAHHAGESVGEHITSVLNNPNASTKEKKRAAFAKAARKWARKRKRKH
jgi:hypothetical protein